MAKVIERVLSRHPGQWGALQALGKVDGPRDAEGFAQWRALVTLQQQPLVADLAAALGVPIAAAGSDKTPPAQPVTSAPAPKPAPALKPGAIQAGMRIECAIGDPNLRNSVMAVLRDVGWVFETKVGMEPPLGVKPIVVRKAGDGMPRACLNWLPQEYGINITGPDSLIYDQIVYQFAHEMTHVFVNPYNGDWFVESVCHAMAYTCLDEMAEKWKTSPPFSNWSSYAPNFASYRRRDVESQLRNFGLKSVEEAHGWVRKNLADFVRKGDGDRPMQGMCAVALWDLFRKHPKSLGAIVRLGEAVDGSGVDFGKWRSLVTPEQRPLVDDIAKEFTFPGVWPVKAPPPKM